MTIHATAHVALLPRHATMHVESIDIVREYSHDRTSIRIIVQIVDGRGTFVVNGRVRLMFSYDDTLQIYREATTDFNGLAEFYLFDVRRGPWSVYVAELHHSFYKPDEDYKMIIRRVLL
ncbi:MAG: hypothetical protein K9W43_08980 [Candidatus Thorarchaeota archaeon]|nr:hypothetical protein [Candidatus Thorarchaeota archaeon]